MTDQASIEPYESIGLAISAAEVELLALGKTAAANDLHKALCQVAALRKGALQAAPPVDLGQAAIALKTSREAPGSIVAPENSPRARELATWALFYGDKLIANALSSRKDEGATPSELERLRHENDCLQARVAQIAYPCSPHCDGYLREQKLARDLTTTARERDDLRHRLDEAADQFAFYADEHAKKGTVAGDAKACTNHAWSVACAKPALTKEPSHGE